MNTVMKTFEMYGHTVEISTEYLEYLEFQLTEEDRNDYGDITNDELNEIICELNVLLTECV